MNERRLVSVIAGAIRDEVEGWNRPHAGMMEPIRQDSAERQAKAVLRALAAAGSPVPTDEDVTR